MTMRQLLTAARQLKTSRPNASIDWVQSLGPEKRVRSNERVLTPRASDTELAPGFAELKTPEGTFLIQERRSAPREPGAVNPHAPAQSYSSSPQMMALGGLIILGVLFASYTTKYDLAIGHAHGVLNVPNVGFLALQLFLARAAYRLFNDVRSFPTLLDFGVMRLARYLPAVIPGVLIGFAVIKTAGYPNAHADLAMLPANLSMMADMVGAREIDASHWRLKIEIIQSIFVAMAWFGPARRYLAILLTVALAHCAFSVGGEPARHNLLTLNGFLTSDGYQPFFVFGVALYQWTQDRASIVWQLMMAVAAGLCFMSNTPMHGFEIICSFLVLGLIAAGHLQFLGRMKWLVHLGQLAFPIYVVHFVLGFAMMHRLEALGCPAPLTIAAASFAAIALGKVINMLFERPAERHVPAVTKAIRALAAKGILAIPQVARQAVSYKNPFENFDMAA